MRTRLRVLLVLLVALTLGGLVVPAPASAAPYCGIRWGSLPKAQSGVDGRNEHVDDIRVGRHRCFDRLVVDLIDAPGFESFSVGYAPGGIRDGADEPVPLRGGAALEVEVGATAYGASGVIHYDPADLAELVDVSGFRTFRQVSWVVVGGDRTVIGIGTRARLPVRAFMLPDPTSGEKTRLVIDVAHRW